MTDLASSRNWDKDSLEFLGNAKKRVEAGIGGRNVMKYVDRVRGHLISVIGVGMGGRF